MEELISTKKHFSKLGWFYLTATGIILAVQLLMSLLINLFCPRILENMNINILLGMVPMYLAGFPLLVRQDNTSSLQSSVWAWHMRPILQVTY